MASIFDLNNNLDQPGQTGFDTFQKLLAGQRAIMQQNDPAVAAQMPTLGANTPGQQIYGAAQQQPATNLASTIQSAAGQAPAQQPEAPAQPVNPMAGFRDNLVQLQVQSGVPEKKAMETANQKMLEAYGLVPKEEYGPQILGKSGGILGTGMGVLDALALAAGMAITRNMPQDQAIRNTLSIASLPSQFAQKSGQQARAFIDDIQGATNAQLAQGNLAMRQKEFGLNADLKNLQILSRLEGLDAISKRKEVLDRVQKGELDVNTPTGRAVLLAANLKPEEIKALMENIGSNRPITPTELAVFGASGIRGATIPAEMTPEQAKQALDLQRENRQILVPEALSQRVGIAGASAEATAQSRQRVEAAKTVAGLGSVSRIVDNLDSLSKQLHTATTPTQANIQGAKLSMQGLAASNETLRLYEAQKKAFIGNLSRTLAAERGVLTEGDIGRIADALPGSRDTVKVRNEKIGFIRSLISTVSEVEKTIANNKEPPGALVEKLMNQINIGPGASSLPQGVTVERVK